MFIFELLALLTFLGTAVYGYRKNNRNILLLSSFCLIIAFAGPAAVSGYTAGLAAPL